VSPARTATARSTPARAGWNAGPPAWTAVVALGAFAIGGGAWSLGRQSARWRTDPPPPIVAAVGAPAPVPIAADAPSAPGPTPAAPARHAPALARRINLNTAPQAELELLPGVGPALAKRIIDHRTQRGPFKRIDDLDDVKGIGPKKLAQLRPLVTVD
jgi:competence protein ComEA